MRALWETPNIYISYEQHINSFEVILERKPLIGVPLFAETTISPVRQANTLWFEKHVPTVSQNLTVV